MENTDIEDPYNCEDDPAADFLAREQDQLAELENDNFEFSTNNDLVGNNEFDDFSAQPDEPQSHGLMEDLGEYVTNAIADQWCVGNLSQSSINDRVSDAVSSGTLVLSAVTMATASLGSRENIADCENGPSDVYSAVSQIDRQRQEPEKLKIWREEQKARLETKDEDETVKNEEWMQQARKELEDWYKHLEEQNTKAKQTNLVTEAAFIKERDENVPGQQWEKVCRLCEFNPKNSKNTKDVSRLRSILLQLKQTPLVR